MLRTHLGHNEAIERLKTKNDYLLKFERMPSSQDYKKFINKLEKPKKKKSKKNRTNSRKKSRSRKRSKKKKRSKLIPAGIYKGYMKETMQSLLRREPDFGEIKQEYIRKQYRAEGGEFIPGGGLRTRNRALQKRLKNPILSAVIPRPAANLTFKKQQNGPNLASQAPPGLNLAPIYSRDQNNANFENSKKSPKKARFEHPDAVGELRSTSKFYPINLTASVLNSPHSVNPITQRRQKSTREEFMRNMMTTYIKSGKFHGLLPKKLTGVHKRKVNYIDLKEHPIDINNTLRLEDVNKLKYIERADLLSSAPKTYDFPKFEFKQKYKESLNMDSDAVELQKMAEAVYEGDISQDHFDIIAKNLLRFVRKCNAEFTEMIIDDLLIETIAILNQKEISTQQDDVKFNIQKFSKMYIRVLNSFSADQDALDPELKNLRKFDFNKNTVKRKKEKDEVFNEIVRYKRSTGGVLFDIDKYRHMLDMKRMKDTRLEQLFLRKGRYGKDWWKLVKCELKIEPKTALEIAKGKIVDEINRGLVPFYSKNYLRGVESIIEYFIDQLVFDVAFEVRKVHSDFVEGVVKDQILP